jgi:hypothetical protein
MVLQYLWSVTCSPNYMRKQPTKPNRTDPEPARSGSGLGPDSAGQSGDDQGLSEAAEADSESVEELLEEGQSFEAGIVSGVEKASDGREVRTRQFPEDDVPLEYQDSDRE